MDYYNVNKKQGIEFCWQTFNNGRLEKKIKSKIIEWDEQNLKWKISDYKIDSFVYMGNKNSKIISNHNKKSLLINLNEDPNRIFKQKREIQSMTSFEIKKFIDEEKKEGNFDLKSEVIEKTQRTSNSFSIIILTILGFSISVKKKKGGLGMKLTLGILMCFIYIFLMKFSTTLTLNGEMDPQSAIWLPNIVFFIISLYTFKKLAY